MTRPIPRSAIGLLSIFLAAGCGQTDGEAEVSGTVAYGGTPVEGGSIAFYPTDGKSPSAGGSIKDGRYSAKVTVGPCRVVFHGTRVVGKKKIYPTPDSPMMDVYEELLPAKYAEQSKVEYDMKPGKNAKDWNLEK